LVKPLLAALAMALVLIPFGSSATEPRLRDRVSALEEQVNVLEIQTWNTFSIHRRYMRSLARCGAKANETERLACFDRLLHPGI
jgi:hypothetical protein